MKCSTQGIAVYMCETLGYMRIDSMSSKTGNFSTPKEMLSFAISLGNTKKLNLIVLYLWRQGQW